MKKILLILMLIIPLTLTSCFAEINDYLDKYKNENSIGNGNGSSESGGIGNGGSVSGGNGGSVSGGIGNGSSESGGNVIGEGSGYFDRIDSIFGTVDEDKLTREVLGQVFECLQRKDAAALSSLFSWHVQREEDFSSKLTYMLDYIDGDVTSCEVVGYPSTHGNINHGKRTFRYDRSCVVSAGDYNYHIAITFCYQDDTDHKNEGIQALSVIRSDYYDYPAHISYSVKPEWGNGIIVIEEIYPEKLFPWD